MPMDILLLVLLAGLVVFMFISSRRRAARMKLEQEAKARAMVPGVKVLLQGGLYGTIVEYDGDDLSKSARVELAPGTVVEVHSQAVLRIVDETDDSDESDTEDDTLEDELFEIEDDRDENAADVAEDRRDSVGDDDAAARVQASDAAVKPEDKPQS